MLAPAPKYATKDAAFFKGLAEYCAAFKGADTKRSILQMSVTLALFAITITTAFISFNAGAWLAYAALTTLSGFLLVRIFIFQHDCGHGSYFKSRKANDYVGRALSVLTWTPYSLWRRAHNMHHASSGNLDKRSHGTIETITVEEFKAFSPIWQRIYRVYRNVVFLLGFGTPFFIIVMQRFTVTEPFLPEIAAKSNMKNSWKSIQGLNLALLVTFGTLGYFLGYGALAAVYMPVLVITSWIGGWLFYIQHQFEDTHWENQENWSYNKAAIMSSSFYDLPKIVQWFTGNIGLHHIHHLNAQIPNYKLQDCLDGHPDLRHINRMTFRDSLASVRLALWDEASKKLVSFKEMKNAPIAAE